MFTVVTKGQKQWISVDCEAQSEKKESPSRETRVLQWLSAVVTEKREGQAQGQALPHAVPVPWASSEPRRKALDLVHQVTKRAQGLRDAPHEHPLRRAPAHLVILLPSTHLPMQQEGTFVLEAGSRASPLPQTTMSLTTAGRQETEKQISDTVIGRNKFYEVKYSRCRVDSEGLHFRQRGLNKGLTQHHLQSEILTHSMVGGKVILNCRW